ncbi:hypothetical protein MN608_02157 [Microdochium nivale]|nr:hypothetical protein MN608_02157 [Microdochium nivale]
MESSTLLDTPKTGRSRFSKALPAPPPGLKSAPVDTIPFPQLPPLSFPPRKQTIGMSTITASPMLPSSLEATSIDSPLRALPPAPFATNSSQLASPALSAIKRKPLRKPVPEAAIITPTTRQMKRVSSISSLLSAYSRSSTESLHRSSHASDGSKDSETSPSSDERNSKASRSQMEQKSAATLGFGAATRQQQPVADQGRPKTPPAQHRTNLSGNNFATFSPASAKQDAPQRREVWRRRASSHRSDRSIVVADLKLAITHGSTAASTTAQGGDGAQTAYGIRSVNEKALPALVQSRAAEPAGSTMNILPFRDYGASLTSQSKESISQADTRPNLLAKQNNDLPPPPPPPPPKQNTWSPAEVEPRTSDTSSFPDSVLSDILATYNFPTPPLGGSTASTPRLNYSEPPVKKSETVKLGRKPVGSPPTTHEAVSDKKHPFALTPGAARQDLNVPTPSVSSHLTVKQLPRIPGVGLRPGDKRGSPAVPFDKSPRVVSPPKTNESVISPVAEEMDKIKHKFKAFVHKHTSSTDASSVADKFAVSTIRPSDDVKSPSTNASVLKKLPVIPSMTNTETPEKVAEKQPQEAPVPVKPDAPLSLPNIETSLSGDLMMPVSGDNQLGGLNVLVPPQQQAKLPSPSSTTSLATMQTSERDSKPQSIITTSDQRSQSQDRQRAESIGNFAGNRSRAGTNTSIASSLGPRGRPLRPAASASNLHGPPLAGFRANSRPRGATNETLPPFAPMPMYNAFRQRPQTSSGPASKGPRPLDGRELYHLADSLSKNALVRKFHETRTESFPVREANVTLTDKDQATLQSIRKLFPLQVAQPTAPSESGIRTAPPITDRHYNCWFRHENWVTSQNQHNSVECQTCHKKEKDPRMVCCGCDVRICYVCYERLMAEKRDLRAMVNKQPSR